MKAVIVVILCTTMLVSAEYISNSVCPVRPLMNNFDITKLAGKWYNVLQYENSLAPTMKCSNIQLSVINRGAVNIVGCELQQSDYSCQTGIISNRNSRRGPLSGSTLFAFSNNPTKPVLEFNYLAVDYNDYAVVYDCKNIENGKSVHNFWVASRTPNLSPKGTAVINDLIDKYFDRSAVKTVYQNPNVCV